MSLNEKLTELAAVRHLLTDAQCEADMARMQLESLPEWAAVMKAEAGVKEMKDAEATVCATVRVLALADYAKTQDKRPGGHVTIRCGKTVLIVDDAQVVRWAIKHDYLDMLRPDPKDTKRVALAIPVDGVIIEETTSAAIDADLSALLA